MAENAFECDRCGAGIGNGGIDQCLVVNDVDETTGSVINLRFCRDREEDGKKVKGCRNRLLTSANVAHFTDRQAKAAKATRSKSTR